MSAQIKNVVAFSAVAAGLQATLPHGLVDALGQGLIPDEVKLANADFIFIGADATNLTVQNSSGAVGSCNALVESWHTIERAFGNQATLALSPRPFVGAGGAGAAIDTPVAAFVFRPGGVQAGNVYTSWTDLVAAMDQVEGFKRLQFDDSLGAITIPSGTFSMANVRWFAPPFLNSGTFEGVRVTIAEGALLPGLMAIEGSLTIRNTATATIPVVLGAVDQVRIDGAVTLESTAGIAIWSVPAGGFVQFELVGNPTFLFATAGPIVTVGAGGTALFVMTGGSAINNGAVAGAGDATFQYRSFGAIAGETFAGLAGTRTDQPVGRTRFTLRAPIGAGALFVNNVNRVDASGGVVASTLPAAAGRQDQIVIVKKVDATANAVNVTPAGADTIDGVAAALPITTSPSAQGASRWFISDGVSDWQTIV